MANDLQLYLTMSNVSGTSILDDSGNHHDGKFVANAKIVDDETFGYCLECSKGGDWVEVDNFNPDPNNTKQFTLEFWIKLLQTKPDSGLDPFWGFPAAGSGTNGYIVIDGSSLKSSILYFVTGDSTLKQSPTSDAGLLLNAWNHLCFTYDGKQLLQFVNGRLQNSSPVIDPSHLIESTTTTLKIGTWDDGFTDRIANVRIYSRALSQQEILADMGTDLGLARRYAIDVEASYPIDFKLLNDHAQAVLYTRVQQQDVDLELVNTSREALTISAVSDVAPDVKAADAEKWYRANHSLYLSFRPGTLWSTDIKLNSTDGWQLVYDQWRTDHVAGYFFFLAKGTNPIVKQPFESLGLKLQGLQIDGRGGSRSTQVELKYQNFMNAGSNKSLSGGRMNYVAIMDEAPNVVPPIGMDWLGLNSILNDGQQQTLTLCIRNESGGTLALDTNSKITLDFPVGDPSCIAKSADELALAVTSTGWENDGVMPNKSTESVSWTLKASQPPTLSNGQHLEVTIKLSSLADNGVSHITLSYDGFLHFSGTVEVPVMKQPLVIAGKNVGIGVEQPSIPLDVNGNAHFGGQVGVGTKNLFANFQVGDVSQNNLYVTGASSLPTVWISSNSTVTAPTSGGLTISPLLDLHNDSSTDGTLAAMTFSSRETAGSNVAVAAVAGVFRDHKSIGDGLGGELAFFTGDVNNRGRLDERVRINQGGNVGIGTQDAKSKLHVKGDVQVEDGQVLINLNGSALGLLGGGTKGDLCLASTAEGRYFRIGSQRGPIMFWTRGNMDSDDVPELTLDNGNLGVGEKCPQQAKLVVRGNVHTNIGAFGWFNQHGEKGKAGSEGVDVSILADARVVAAEFNAVSDVRAKTAVTPLNAKDSLAFVQQLRPVSFQYLNKVQHGHVVREGFIAQEVEDLRPDLVRRDRGMVPVLQPFAEYQFEQGLKYRIATETGTIDWKKGDNVPSGEKFVVEREVDDFRTLDYESLFSIAVSALQEQQSQIEKLQAEIQEIKKALCVSAVNT